MKDSKIRALVIIPSKMDSTRVKNKNLRIIAGQTLLEHSLDYAMKSKYTIDIIVTSESLKVADLVHGYRHQNILDVYTHMVGIDNKALHIVKRDKEYMGEREVADVYVNVIQKDIYNPDNHSHIKENGSILTEDLKNVTHIVGVQPDHPDRKVDLDNLLEYAVENKYDDLFTIDKYNSLLFKISKIFFVNLSMSLQLDIKAASPTTSGNEELSLQITGIPQVIASITGIPKPS